MPLACFMTFSHAPSSWYLLSSTKQIEVVQLVMYSELSGLPNLALVRLAVADEHENVVVAAVDLVAERSAGRGGHALAERAGGQVNTGGLGAVGVGTGSWCAAG